jgi:hypothetical protein
MVFASEGETPSRQPAEPALSEVEGMPVLLSPQIHHGKETQ